MYKISRVSQPRGNGWSFNNFKIKNKNKRFPTFFSHFNIWCSPDIISIKLFIFFESAKMSSVSMNWAKVRENWCKLHLRNLHFTRFFIFFSYFLYASSHFRLFSCIRDIKPIKYTKIRSRWYCSCCVTNFYKRKFEKYCIKFQVSQLIVFQFPLITSRIRMWRTCRPRSSGE